MRNTLIAILRREGVPKTFLEKGFTLAEVLITLGVVGIVAALVMPTLTENIQRKVWVAQLKQTVVVLTTGFHKISGEAVGLENTSLGTKVYFTMADGSTKNSETHNDSYMYPFVQSYLKKTFKIQKVGCGTVFDTECPNQILGLQTICWYKAGVAMAEKLGEETLLS